MIVVAQGMGISCGGPMMIFLHFLSHGDFSIRVYWPQNYFLIRIALQLCSCSNFFQTTKDLHSNGESMYKFNLFT